MKYIYLLFCLGAFFMPATLTAQNATSAGSPNLNSYKNYRLTVVPTIETATVEGLSAEQCGRTVEYFDGLGRLIQTVAINISPDFSDLITCREYDYAGRPSLEWLPVVSTNNNGAFLPYSVLGTAASTTYSGDLKPYSARAYESSPLERVLKQSNPGQAWYDNDRNIKTSYLTNVAGNDTLNCIHYRLSSNASDTIVTVSRVGNYSTGSLSVIHSSDEDDHHSWEFKDGHGQTVLIRQLLSGESGNVFCDTYYIYDVFGNLGAVLPPLASGGMRSGSSWSNSSSALLRDYAFLYQYDSRNRCRGKRLPGCGWVYYIHDKSDRLIFSQDGEQRKRNEWSFFLPDVFNRTCLTGTCRNTFNVFSSVSPLDDTPVIVTRNNTTGIYKGYSSPQITLVDPVVLNVNYYDDYDFMVKNGVPSSVGSGFAYETVTGFGERSDNALTYLTGTMVAVLDDSSAPSYLYSVMYYDEKGRMVQSKSTNRLPGGIEKEYFAYNFSGQATKYKHIHSATGKATQTELNTYTYDHAGRLLTNVHQLNDGTSVTLVDNQYDSLGRLLSNKRNGQLNLKTDYAYNVRSWTKSISGSLFNQTLYYNDSRSGGTNTPCYSGNISGMDWNVANDTSRGYDFSYDDLSRLTSADYLENNTRSDKFNASYSYDKHGNVLSLRRYGNRGTTTYGEIDNLTLSYQGNQLVKVEDTAPDPTLSMSMDFRNGTDLESEYSYDANGNQTKDLNKGITGIEYNFLNLPKQVNFSGANNPKNEYVYSAAGAKLSVIHESTTEKRTDYVGNMIYENGSLKRILVEGGYIEDGEYHFYLQDHLGNNRVVAKADGTVVQTNHFYPYGMSFAEGTFADKQPYKYNGKELDTENGLNLYDYDARQMNAAFGRFTGVDPLTEKFHSISPYAYCANNPVSRIDPNGCDWYQSTNNEDEYIWREGHKDIDGYIRLGTSMSFWFGEDSYLNFYQNAGIKANQAVNAFDLISSSGKLQNQLLGKNSPLSEDSKSALFNGLNSRAVDEIARPIGESLVEYGAGILTGAALGKVAGYVWSKISTKMITKGTTVYRAIGAAEEASINATNSFLLKEGQTEVKYFAKTIEDAHWYGKNLYPNGYTIIRGSVRTNVNVGEYWYPNIDIGAYVFPKEILKLIKPIP